MIWGLLDQLATARDLFFSTFSQALPAVDLAAAAVFAITGALVASRKQMDVVGFIWLGTVTGIGGGTVRDLLLGVPVFWVAAPTVVLVCFVVSVIVFFTAHLVQSRYRLILWLDAIGMALVTVAGTTKGLDAGTGPLVACVMGVVTASVGGVIRDVLGQEPSIVLRREIYVTASAVGAGVCVMLATFGQSRSVAVLAGFLCAFILRGLALNRGWTLPTYRARPGRVFAEMPVPPSDAASRDAPIS